MDDDSDKKSGFLEDVKAGFSDTKPKDFGSGKDDSANDEDTGGSKSGRAAETLKSVGGAAASIATKRPAGGVKGAQRAEATSQWTGSGKQPQPRKGGKKNFAKIAIAAPMLAIVGIGVAIIAVLGAPVLLLGGIDMGLQDAGGFLETQAILEKQAEYVTGELLSSGNVPDDYAKDLVAQGIEVGQVTAAGDFVQTNRFIADLGQPKEVAGIGEYYNNISGALSVRFNGQIVSADNFVAAVESNPKMYAAYSEAADISARYYYSNDVNKIFKEELNVSRNNFATWKDTGNSEENQKQFNEIVAKAINKNSKVGVAGYIDGGSDDSQTLESGLSGDASSIIKSVAENTTGDRSTAKAAQLLNTAISSSEPYKATSAFVVIEDGIQKTRLQDDGPANEIMNMLNEKIEVTYRDVTTGETKTIKKSILETQNFGAAVGGGGYSREEAANYSRDRVLITTDSSGNTDIIEDTSIASDGQKSSKSVLQIGWGEAADTATLGKAESAVSMAITQNNSDLLTSEVGGNRIVEGSSFTSSIVNQRALGAMPSDSETNAAYHREVDEILARQAEADRATRSPFDISSSNTFLGSIVHSSVKSIFRNRASTSGETSVTSTIGVLADLTSQSTNSMFGQALADGNTGRFTEQDGNCPSSQSVSNVASDLYCTNHTTVPTGYMNMTTEDWANAGIGLNSSGKVEKGSEYAEFGVLGEDRPVSVGVKSADMCEEYKKLHPDVAGDLFKALTSFLGIYQSCDGVDPSIANGTKYTLSSSNGERSKTEKLAAAALHDTVYSLLAGKQSSLSAYKEQYYAAHPKDESPAGQLARISGLTKEEAQIALNYQAYLNILANYNPDTRYAFSKPAVEIEEKLDFGGDAKRANDGVMILGIAYRDERNRSFAV